MKRLILVGLLTILISSQLHAQFCSYLKQFGDVDTMVRFSDAIVRNDTLFIVGYKEFNEGSAWSGFILAMDNNSGNVYWKREYMFGSSDTSQVLATATFLGKNILSGGLANVSSGGGMVLQLNSPDGTLLWRKIYLLSGYPSINGAIPANMEVVGNKVYIATYSGAIIIDSSGTVQQVFISEPYFMTDVQAIGPNRLLWSGVYMNQDTNDIFYLVTDTLLNVLVGYKLGTWRFDGGSIIVFYDITYRNLYVVNALLYKPDSLIIVAPTIGISPDPYVVVNSTMMIKVGLGSGNIQKAYAFWGNTYVPSDMVVNRSLLHQDNLYIYGTRNSSGSGITDAFLLKVNPSDLSIVNSYRAGYKNYSTSLPVLTATPDGTISFGFWTDVWDVTGSVINQFGSCQTCFSDFSTEIAVVPIRDSLSVRPITSSVFDSVSVSPIVYSFSQDKSLPDYLVDGCPLVSSIEMAESSEGESGKIVAIDGRIKLIGFKEAVKQIEVYDALGRKVAFFSGNITELELPSELPPTLLVVKVTTENRVVTEKVWVQ
ncbi:MAG: T9SS type A sorting domain-containing protein [Chlorobi bacterium]|nr:T9SS type A sorting domain-containing protein [Chlorobiota bacterium]